jgi:hypothetical protein
MPTILIVEKNGNIKPTVVKNAVETDFYKKAGFKSAEGFSKHTTWKLNINNTEYHIALYGKTTGKANMENKYEFPPPVDTVLFFGNCVLANVIDGEVIGLDADDWELIYQYLYGGFEDLSSGDDDDDSAVDAELDGLEKTKDGYAKDGFIVDDDEADDDFQDSDSDLELSSVESAPKKCARRKKAAPAPAKGKTTKAKGKTATPQQAFAETTNCDVDGVLDCTSELSEDSYD